MSAQPKLAEDAARAKVLHADDGRMLVTLSVAELRALVADAVVEALQEYEQGRPPAPELVSGTELARLLSCSRATVHRLALEGMPHVRLGDARRYRLADVRRCSRNASQRAGQARAHLVLKTRLCVT